MGNSSSSSAEALRFGIESVNIGDRQRGRLKADSVIACELRRGDRRSPAATLFCGIQAKTCARRQEFLW